MTSRKRRILETERRSITSHSVENSLWKRLWTCSKAEGRMNESVFFDTSILI
jgi:hypothetical protein